MISEPIEFCSDIECSGVRSLIGLSKHQTYNRKIRTLDFHHEGLESERLLP